MKTELSSLDLKYLLPELKALEGGKIQKIYHEDREIHVSVYVPSSGNKTLVVGKGKIFLTSYRLKHSEMPSHFCMFLRKYLSNQIIESVSQKGFERIVFIKTNELVLVAELFGEGNIILLDKDRKILSALEVQKWKDRIIGRYEKYQLPPPIINPLSLDANLMEDILSEKEKQIVAFLAREMSLGGPYSEEICFMAGIEKSTPCKDLKKKDVKKLVEAISEISSRKKKPRIYYENGKNFDVAPFPLKNYAELDEKQFESFNEAVDEFFVEKENIKDDAEISKTHRKKEDRLSSRLKDQKDALENLVKVANESRDKAELIYREYPFFDKVVKNINALAEKHGWSELQKKLDDLPTQENIAVKSVNPAEKTAVVEFSGTSICLDLKVSLEQNAAYLYEKSKRAKKKLKGVKTALVKTRNEIEKAKDSAKKTEEKREAPKKLKQTSLLWHEKFRWFISSSGVLCVAGKDATSNEILIKKHTEKDDLVFHTEISGSPFLVVKSKGKEVDIDTLKEASQFVAVYSRAWNAGVGSIDTYYVTPEQVSKKAPAGEYISKGSFMIYGKKSWLKAELKLAFGFHENRIISGPVNTISSKTKKYVIINPGNMKSKALAQKIKSALMSKCSKEEIEIMKKLNLDDIQRFIPAGKGDLVKS